MLSSQFVRSQTWVPPIYPLYESYIRYDNMPDKNLFLSPDVASFQKYHFQDVNLYTGKVDITIPLYEIKSGEITVPITLTYNSGGVKIDDIASNVGTGWNLNAGGSIYRSIKDIDDWEYYMDQYSEEDWDLGQIKYQFVSSKGFNRDIDEIENPFQPGYGILSKGLAKLDASPDRFSVSAPGLSTEFYVNKWNQAVFIDGNGSKSSMERGVIEDVLPKFGFDNRNVKGIGNLHNLISCCGNPIGTPLLLGKNIIVVDYRKFEIKNINGVRYAFNSQDVFEAMSSSIPGPEFSIYGLIPFYVGLTNRNYSTRVSSWHLNEIEDKNKNKVYFNYEKYAKPNVQKAKNRMDDALLSHANPYNLSPKCIYGHMPDFYASSQSNGAIYEKLFKVQEYYTKFPQVNRIKEIRWSEGTVNFEYNLNRADALDEKALTKVIIKDNQNKVIKSYEFTYNYFNSKENCVDWTCKRLRLDYIDIRGVDNSVERYYTFDYEYSNPLPKVYSLQQDFLGYYNNNGVEYINDDDIKSPILYYHKNQGKNSVLPFQLPSNFTMMIPGDFSLAPNNYSLSGLLKKITYPTKGYSEFEYENHKFLYLGQEYTAGGARIKKQKLNDGNGNERIMTYEYSENGQTSGYINSLPVFGYPFAYDYNKTSNNVSFVTYDKSKGAIELTDGSFVGYSKVIEREQGNGFKEYLFHSAKNYPNEDDIFTGEGNWPQTQCGNFLASNSSYPNLNFINNDIKRAKLSSEKTFNQSNGLIAEKTYEYNHKIFNTLSWDYRTLIDNHYVDSHLTAPYVSNTFMNYSSKLRTERNLLSDVTTKEYFPSGIVETKESYVYDPNYPLITSQQTTFSPTENAKTVYKYPHEVHGSEQSYFMIQLINENRLSEPVITENYKNGEKISETHLLYDRNESTGNLLLPTEEHFKKGSGNIQVWTPTDRKVQYTKYNPEGRLLEYKLEDGTLVRIVWGYGNMIKGYQPIAKIVNPQINNDDFEGWISNAINLSNGDNGNCFGSDLFGACYEAQMRGVFDRLRQNFPTSSVTSYTYDPLIGATSVTQPNGQIEYYRYDNFGRLQFIYDHKEKLVKRIDYNYKD